MLRIVVCLSLQLTLKVVEMVSRLNIKVGISIIALFAAESSSFGHMSICFFWQMNEDSCAPKMALLGYCVQKL